MAILGGPHYFLGPMLGSVIYTLLNAFVTGYTEYWPLVSGTVIIIVVLLLPGGVLGVYKEKFGHLKSKESTTLEHGGP